MADVIFVGVICAFFALCVVYIRWCDRIIGPDEFAAPGADGDEVDSSSATPTAIATTTATTVNA